LRDYERFLSENQSSIADFKGTQQAAFEAERQRWIDSGQLSFSSEARDPMTADGEASTLPSGAEAVEAHVPGSVWKVAVKVGERVRRGQTLLIVESMKMEIAVEAQQDGVVLELRVAEGRTVAPGQVVAVLQVEASP
jgi:urea carboxylase